MYNQQYSFGSTIPTATQPFGYSMINIPNYNQQMQQSQQNQNATTNMIFVSGYEDVVCRYQLPNTSVLYKHNDKDICYIKTLDNKGQFQIKEYDLVEKSHNADTKDNNSIDLSSYAKTSDLDHILCEIKTLKEQLLKFKQGGTQNGTTTRPTSTTTATTN